MKKNLYLIFFTAFIITSCKKDKATIYDTLKEPYSTGSIQIQHQFRDNRNKIKDTVVSLTANDNTPGMGQYYDVSRPGSGTIRLKRIHPNNPEQAIFIQFSRTNLNTLTLPYTFKAFDASIAPYVSVEYKDIYAIIDSAGNKSYFGQTYRASSAEEDFTLTILSRENNRLQGSFKGTLKVSGGEPLEVKYGLFDILIMEL